VKARSHASKGPTARSVVNDSSWPPCFPHAAQAILVERHVRDPRDGTLRPSAAALGITSRPAGQGGTPEALATAVRTHWDTEALRHVRDVTMKEDASRLRSGTSPQVMASVRNIVIAALRLSGFTNTGRPQSHNEHDHGPGVSPALSRSRRTDRPTASIGLVSTRQPSLPGYPSPSFP
jgi:hypothetical protein